MWHLSEWLERGMPSRIFDLQQATIRCLAHVIHLAVIDLLVSVVGGKMVLYVNHLQRLNWRPEHAFTIVLKSAMNLTCKNRGFYYDTRGRIKSWSFRSASNVVAHILENKVNSYDSNGVIAIPISTLGDEKQNLPFFCLPILPRNPLNVLGHIIHHWKDIFKENTMLLESWERFRIDGEIPEISFMNLNLRGKWSLDP